MLLGSIKIQLDSRLVNHAVVVLTAVLVPQIVGPTVQSDGKLLEILCQPTKSAMVRLRPVARGF